MCLDGGWGGGSVPFYRMVCVGLFSLFTVEVFEPYPPTEKWLDLTRWRIVSAADHHKYRPSEPS